MVAYSFQPQFVDPILSGRKQQTIRAIGKRRHARAGEVLQLYTGMRTRQCRLIGYAKCLDVQNIMIADNRIRIAGVYIEDEDAFAQADGFADRRDMAKFWKKHHPGVARFDGLVIRWEKFVRSD